MAYLNVEKSCVALTNIADSESAQANLNHGAIVQDLQRHVGIVDTLLQVGHENTYK